MNCRSVALLELVTPGAETRWCT